MSDAPNVRPDGRSGLDRDRAEAIRGLLTETVEREPERVRSVRRRRVVLLSVAGVAAVALAVGGVALAGGGPLPSGSGEAAPTALPSDRPQDDPGTSPGVVEPAGTPSATPVPPPAPTPVVDDPTAPSTWVVSTDRIGPLVLGGQLEEQAARLTTFQRYTDDGYGCPASFFSDGRGLTLTLSRGSSPDVTQIVTVSADRTSDDPAALASATPRTASGIGLGDDEARLAAAYPDAELTLDHDENYGTQYAVTGDDGQYLVFVLGSDDRITDMSVGTTRMAPPEYCG